MTKQFPPFELQCDRGALSALEAGLTGFTAERFGWSTSNVWLLGDSGKIWIICVDQRDLQFKFEVFTLALETLDAVEARIAAWEPPPLASDMPDDWRRLLSERPASPTPPAEFQPWPFASWTVEALRRVEYIIEDVPPVPTLVGNNPNTQGAAQPGKAPPDASASCEVAAGLLFTGSDGRRLLIAVDWMPMSLVATQDEGEINDYVATCETVRLAEYARRLNGANPV